MESFCSRKNCQGYQQVGSLPGPLPLRLGGGVLRSRPGARSGPGTRPGSGRAGPGVRPGPGSRLVSVVSLDLESSAVELEIVLAFKSGLDAAPVAELDQAFAGARRVRVGVADLAGVAEEVLQILKTKSRKFFLRSMS